MNIHEQRHRSLYLNDKVLFGGEQLLDCLGRFIDVSFRKPVKTTLLDSIKIQVIMSEKLKEGYHVLQFMIKPVFVND
jgi:hypothetical protein